MNRILIRSRDSKDEIVQTYPFLFKLRESYPEAKIDIIVGEGLKEYYQFLPFEVKVHEVPSGKRGILGNFHYAVNLHDVFNVNLYFDFISDRSSSCLGVTFKAEERIGLDRGVHKIAYHKRVKIDALQFYDSHMLKLLELHLEKAVDDFSIGGIEAKSEEDSNVTPLFEKVPAKRYLLVFIDSLEEEFWKDFFDQFEETHFIFWRFRGKEELEEFFIGQSDKNKYEIIDRGGAETLDYYLAHSSGVLTNQKWISVISSIQKKSSFLFLNEGENESYSDHIKSSAEMVNFDHDSLISIPGEAPNKRKEIRVNSEVVDFIQEKLEN